jgi:hypothetical protein
MSSHRRIKKVVSAFASVVVVASAALYVFGPTEAALSITITSRPAEQSNKLALSGVNGPLVSTPIVLTSFTRPASNKTELRRVKHHGLVTPPTTEVVYGAVSGPSNSVPERASVTLAGSLLILPGTFATIRVGPDGTFLSPVTLRPGRYAVLLRAEFGTKWYTGADFVTIQPSKTYDISAVLKYESVFTFLPVTSY